MEAFSAVSDIDSFCETVDLDSGLFTVFWNSMKIVGTILAGQLVFAVPAAWAFAAFRFKGRKLLFTLYVILMLLPFQVTMLPSYLVLDGMNLMNTHAAVILPAVFLPFRYFSYTAALQRYREN